MSSLIIAGDTSGSVTLSAPSVAGTTTLTLPSTSGTIITTNTMPTGSVLQVVQGTKTDALTTTSTSFVIPTGLSASITPSSSSNKILIMCYFNFCVESDTGHTYARLQRDGTGLNVGDAASSRPQTAVVQNNFGNNAPPNYSICYLDSPSSTSAITYSLGIRSSNGTTVYFNRSVRDADASTYDGRSSSAIIVMEIKG